MVAIICQPREGNFRHPPLAEAGCGAHSFSGGTEGCAVWGGRGTVARPRGFDWRPEGAGVENFTETDLAVKIQTDVITITAYSSINL